MTGIKRLGTAAALALCLTMLVGEAAAEPTAAFSIAGPSTTVAEGASATFTVTLSAAETEEVTVDFATAVGTATASDFATSSGTLTFAAGDTSEEIIVATTDETPALDEDPETFSVQLSNPAPAGTSIGTASATATIEDDDAPPTVSIAGPAENVPEGAVAQFQVTLSAASGRTVEVRYQTFPASSPDFQGTANSSILIAPNASGGVIEVQTNDVDGNKTFAVGLNGCENNTCTPTAPTQASATIQDNNAPPPPTVSISNAQVGEGARNPDTGNVELRFTLTLSAASTQPVSVAALTFDDTAVAPSDYQQKSQPFIFAPGETEKTFVVVVNDDVLDETNETIGVALLNSGGAEIGRAVGTIIDNDQTSGLSISDTSADEPGSMSFTVTLAPASKRTVTVGYATMDGTAAAGSDYTPASGSLTFQPDQTTQTVTVAVLGDTINEDNETVLVNLVNASGARIADAQGQGTIIDKNAPPSLSISDTVASEGGGARFIVQLAGNTLRTVTVGFGTADGTAREPGDYTARRGTLTFAPGEKTKTLEVTVVDDALAETVETFSVSLGDAVNATITKSRGVATIEASDQVGTSPSGSPPRPATPPASPTLLPKMVLAPRTVNVTKTGFARLFLTCTKLSPIACRGSITLQTTGKPPVKLGSKTFLVAKGKKKTVGVKLTLRARKLLAKRPTLRARVVVLVKTGTKSLRVVPGVITLKAAPKPAKKAKTTARPAP